MKLQALLLIIVIFLTCGCECKLRKVERIKLNQIYDEMAQKSKVSSNNKRENIIQKTLDLDCVKNYFKLPQGNKIIVTELEFTLFAVAAVFKCSDQDNGFKRYFFDDLIHSGQQKQLKCLKWYLKNLEPESKLVENFELSEDKTADCQKTITKAPIEKEQRNIESVLGPLDVYTCGAVTGADDYMRLISKGAIIKYGNISEKLKEEETEKVKKYFLGITFTTIDCIFKRFEDNPEAFLANDTLNYYYKQELSSSEPEEDEPNEYDKKLKKVEGTINYDCVKEKLNLPENGQKAFLEVEASLLIASAKSKCIKVDPLEFSNLFIDYAAEEFRGGSDRYFSCAKYKLKELEPTSKLAVITSDDEQHEKFCNRFDISVHAYSTPYYTYRYNVGRLNETTCGVLTNEIKDVVSLKTLLLGIEKDKDVKIKETQDLFNFVTDKLHKLADCILERNQ